MNTEASNLAAAVALLLFLATLAVWAGIFASST